LSFADYLPEANRLFSGGNPKWSPVDDSNQAVQAAVSALLLGSSTKAYAHVADFTLQNATVSLWYKNNKQETVDKALAQVRRVLNAIGIDHPGFRIRLGTGAIALQQSINDSVDRYQWLILAVLNLVIFVGCAYAYRSWVAGLLLLVPVNLANLFLTAGMVLMGLGLDVNSLPITAIGIGVGIDYGIYLLSRVCEEYRGARHVGDSIQAAVTTTGKAIFFTASIMLAGILPWYFLSGLRFMADMGLLLCLIMLINLVCALIVLPLLLDLLKPKFLDHEHRVVAHSIDLESLGMQATTQGAGSP
jgi:predicted RND superfamily exporter protein